MGSGSRKSKIFIIGEAPGEREDESHQAFVGPSGQLLTEILSEAGISREECYITNVAKCRPPDNRQPTPAELKTCSATYLMAELKKVRPDHVLLLGNSALRAVTGSSGITKHRGSIYSMAKWGIEAEALATFHPAYVLRSPQFRSALVADVERFARLVKGWSVELEKTKIKIIRTVPQLRWLRKQLMQVPVISYDIETYVDGTKEHAGDQWRKESRICSIAFSWEEGEAVVVPLHHESRPWKNPDAVLRSLKPCLERPEAKYVAHNGIYDARWLASRGIFVNQTFDTMLAGHMLEENRLKGLKPLSQILLGAEAYNVGVDTLNCYYENLRRLCIYNGKDTDFTLRLYNRFKREMKEDLRVARVFAKLMMPASNAMTRVELVGPYIDPERWEQQVEFAIKKRDKVEAALRESCGDINLRSPRQIAKWLFGKKGKVHVTGPKKHPVEVVGLGLPIIEETDTGAPSTNEVVIKTLAQTHPELKKLLDYRWWETKVLRTYLAQWEDVDDHERFHPGYKLFGTVTGRLSGDFQQVPRKPYIRSIVGAPEGWTFVEADYSQVELRIAAWLAPEPRLMRIFLTGQDAHLQTAAGILEKLPEDVSYEERSDGKHANFGFLYGMGPQKFVEYCWEHFDKIITLGEAEKYHARYHESYPGLHRWHDRQRRLVRRYGRVYNPIGRCRHLPTVLSSDGGVRAEAERQAINSPVQSFASDLMLLSLVRLHAVLPSTKARVVGTVHDSILFELRNDYVEEGVQIIHQTMVDKGPMRHKFGVDIEFPIEVDIKTGTHWGEGTIWKPS